MLPCCSPIRCAAIRCRTPSLTGPVPPPPPCLSVQLICIILCAAGVCLVWWLLTAAAGKYGDQIGLTASSQCKDCAMGTYSDQTGLSQCKDCPPGKFGAKEGHITKVAACPNSCTAGRYGSFKSALTKIPRFCFSAL